MKVYSVTDDLGEYPRSYFTRRREADWMFRHMAREDGCPGPVCEEDVITALEKRDAEIQDLRLETERLAAVISMAMRIPGTEDDPNWWPAAERVAEQYGTNA